MGVRFVLHEAAVRELLRSPGVQQDLERRARSIAAAAGEGMEASSNLGPNRAHASVITTTTEARVAEATQRSLSRALDAGRA